MDKNSKQYNFKEGEKIRVRSIDSSYSEVETFIRTETKFKAERIVAVQGNGKEHSYDIKKWHIIPALEEYTTEDYKKAEILSSAKNANEITCPYCGEQFGDSWEYNDCSGDTEEKCDSCGKEFIFCVNFEVSYDSFYKD